MANIKISELEQTTNLNTGCCFPLVQEDETKKVTYGALKGQLYSDLNLSQLHTHQNKSALDSISEQDIQKWNNASTGTSDYNDLENKPKINGVELSGNKSLTDLGITISTNIVDGTAIGSARSTTANDNLGPSSFATGKETTASGDYSHAEGRSASATGDTSHAEGRWTVASGGHSHAEGRESVASGEYSHAEGRSATASGDSSHAEGRYTIAKGDYSHAQGIYNIQDDDSLYAHIVGNGSSDSSRSNAHTLDWNGNAWFQGDVYVGSTSGTNKDDGSVKLERTSNKVTSLSSASTDTEYPTAKCVYDLIGDVETLLGGI